MAHRDGAPVAADTVTDPAMTGSVDGESVVGAAGPDGAGAPDAPGTEPAPAGAEADEPTTADDATVTGRRAGRFPRPAGPWTPTFGLSLSAIRGQRTPASSEGTAELRRSLADTEAQTNELREALDELRQALDATPARTPAGPGSGTRRRRRGLLLLLLAVIVVAALVGALLLARGDSDGAAPAPSTTASGQVSATATTDPSGSTGPSGSAGSSGSSPVNSGPSASVSSPAAPSLTTTPLPWPGGAVLVPAGAPATGPGVDTPGTDVTVAIDPDLRHLDVFERAVLATPTDVVTISLPPATVWTGGLAGANPQIEDLQVELDGAAVRVQPQGAGWFALPATSGQATTIVLRYRVAKAVYSLAGLPNPARRMLTVPTLTGRTSIDSGQPVTLRISDPRVRGVWCLSSTVGTVRCAMDKAGTQVATLPPGGTPGAIIQADLP